MTPDVIIALEVMLVPVVEPVELDARRADLGDLEGHDCPAVSARDVQIVGSGCLPLEPTCWKLEVLGDLVERGDDLL